MSDPVLQDAIDIVDQSRTMPAAEAVRYLFDRYRTASPVSREELVLALAGALITVRKRTEATS